MTGDRSSPAKNQRRPGPKRATPDYLERAALHYLERFSSSAENLRRLLMRKVRRSAEAHGTDLEEGGRVVDALVERYRAAGLIDDAVYAGARAASLHRRGVSQRLIAGRLAAKGVDGEIIGETLAGIREETGGDLAAACHFVRRRRLGPLRQGAAREGHRDKDLAAMARAGFGFDIARKVLACADEREMAALLEDERG